MIECQNRRARNVPIRWHAVRDWRVSCSESAVTWFFDARSAACHPIPTWPSFIAMPNRFDRLPWHVTWIKNVASIEEITFARRPRWSDVNNHSLGALPCITRICWFITCSSSWKITSGIAGNATVDHPRVGRPRPRRAATAGASHSVRSHRRERPRSAVASAASRRRSSDRGN